MADEAIFKIGDVAISGWEEMEVTSSMLDICGSFSFRMSDSQNGDIFRTSPHLPCRVYLGADPIINGYVDDAMGDVDSENHTVRISGRDRTCDLVDCSIVSDTKGTPYQGMVNDQNAFQLIQSFCKPFGIKVLLMDGVSPGPPFPIFGIQRGETIFEAIDRACKMRALVPITTENGDLLLAQAGLTRATDSLMYGKNIKSASSKFSYKNRFSDYRAEVQIQGDGSVLGFLSGAAVTAGTAKDSGVSRYRPHFIHAVLGPDNASLNQRAATEALYRAADSQTIEVVVQGWRQSDGTLWRKNTVTSVDAPMLYTQADMLISAVSYQKSERNGTTAKLSLMRPDAFTRMRSLQAEEIKPLQGIEQGFYPQGQDDDKPDALNDSPSDETAQ